MKIFKPFVLMMFLTLVSTGAYAQASNRKIAGTITDPTNKFIEGLKVRATNIDTKKHYRTTTNESGFFEFAEVPSGTYILVIKGDKRFLTKKTENIVVGLDIGAMYNTSLKSKPIEKNSGK